MVLQWLSIPSARVHVYVCMCVCACHVCRLIEQTLDSCQLKRVRSAAVKVDLRWLCTHLQRWGMLGRDFNLQELVIIAIFAKQVCTHTHTHTHIHTNTRI